ncbi:family 78 glycoside hydrolase catalytic domain [Lacisediminihabitans profunda]|uniref:alpha-L-rhamnosidase n=1 Tax=Lacisediminihabitans profunda TaxID=2594790 RepID=A0A5C8UTX0_9MICO|nr:family 78 glycoside hydrolase catalytic domain [Lacisediminihabitans profunda]TXN31393.1 Bacterial alpha-L-rhamnosidase [Lacisediminihabitans profunda]
MARSLGSTSRARHHFKTSTAAMSTIALTLGLLMSSAPTTAAHAVERPAVPVTRVDGLRTNGLQDPLGIGGAGPTLSWLNESSGRGVTQIAYEVRVSGSESALAKADVWSSGKVVSGEQLNVAYAGPALASQTRYWWQVRIWDNSGKATGWAKPAWFETGILTPTEWSGKWIGGTDTAAATRAKWHNYTVSVDFHMDNLVLGVYARAADLNNAYLWQLSVADGTPRFRPHVKQNGGFTLLDNKDISSVISKDALLTGRHTFSITFDGSTIISSIDGTEIDRRTDTTFTEGYVGFRQSAAAEGPEQSTIYAVTVVSPTSGTLLDTTFADGKNPFSDGKIVNGAYQAFSPLESIFTVEASQPLLRKDFTVAKHVTAARVYASALGVYELSINGARVGDESLAPGWTDYSKRIDYQTYDVTALVQKGANTIAAMIANGWYSGNIASFGPHHYGTTPALIAQLRIDFSDGTHQWVATDDSWKSTKGPLVSSDIIDGENYDARQLPVNWSSPKGSTASWTPVDVGSDAATALLEPQSDEPVRVTAKRPATLLAKQPTNGAWLYDMKQNMVGVMSLKLTGVAGQKVRIRYGEMLNPDGTLYTANLRSAKATDYYTFATTGTEDYVPKFTYHGFRFVEVTGLATAPAASNLTGLVLGTDLQKTGTLTTSNAMLNQLQSNITWGQRGNFLSIPTDTPARDERLGWMGDINVFAPTASYNSGTLSFLSKWLQDVRDSQHADGDYPGVAPDPIGIGGGSGWADAGITVPNTLWTAYGDTGVIREGWASMKKFMDYVQGQSGASLIRTQGGYGDWLNLDDPTDQSLIGTAYFASDARMMSQMASAIGETADAARYAQLEKDVTASFLSHYLSADGTMAGNSQTAYALSIGLGLVPADRLAQVGDRFVARVAAKNYHLSTGFIGTPWLLPALTATGHSDVAYRLLLNKDYPSWGYEVASGATTMWERWDSLKPDGTFGDVGMNSFNHYAYGAVGNWMYQNIGGISSASAGYKTSVIAPNVGGGLTTGAGSFDSVYGTVASNWAVTSEGMTLDATVPMNTTSTIRIPAISRWAVTEGGRPLDSVAGVTKVSEANGIVEISVGSGEYHFTSSPANVGLTVQVTGVKSALPGSTVAGVVQLTNTGRSIVAPARVDLALNAGLTAAPAVFDVASLRPGESRSIPFTVKIPLTVAAGPLTATATVTFTPSRGEPRSFTVSSTLATIEPAITVTSATRATGAGDPAASAVVTTAIANTAAAPITGRLVVESPTDWQQPATGPDITIAPGATATVLTTVPIPLSITAGDFTLAVRFVSEGSVLATTSAPLTVSLATPPATFTDHVDFGEASSEAVHAVTGSPSSGTSVEAGLTRRYSGVTSPGSYFEFTGAVIPGKPFILRAIETYDRAQTKDYEISVNGTRVATRVYERTAGGPGTETYQILIPDDGTLTSTGAVTIRLTYTGVAGHYDPSIADAWLIQAP